MCPVPVVPHYQAAPEDAMVRKAEALAEELSGEQPDLMPRHMVKDLMPRTLDEGPALHLDDLSGIPLMGRFYDVTFLEDRARFRATEGDFLASCTPPIDSFTEYCDTMLGLGTVTWLRPVPDRDPLGLAFACWTDQRVRHLLLQAIRQDRLLLLHPHMGSFPVWALAGLLQRATGKPLKVIAPPPGLSAAVNDKGWLARLIARLFGAKATPHVEEAWNYATLARLAQQLSQRTGTLVLKIPDSAGGAGNLVIDAKRFRNRPLGEIRRRLKAKLRNLGHLRVSRILIGIWKQDVLASPSTQLWIPPLEQGPPVVEGVFEQVFEGAERYFVGSREARLPPAMIQELVDRSWLVGTVLQRLGYVGRCSFDLLVVGDTLPSSTIEFIECNGRWGGTSIPMTLMNRLFGDWHTRPYTTSEVFLDGLERWSFQDVLDLFGSDLYDARTGQGHLIFYSPAGLESRSGISALAFGDTWEQAAKRMDTVTARLQQAIEPAGTDRTRAGISGA